MLGKDSDPDTELGAEILDEELIALLRNNAGYINELRVRRLGDQLSANGPLAIRHTRPGFSRDRVTVALDDDTTLKLKLFWPLTVTLASLISVAWEADIGWVVGAKSTRGERVNLYAWSAQLIPAR